MIAIGIFFLRLLARTWRYELSGDIPIPGSSIIAFWHENMLPGWHLHRGNQAIALVSKSNDGMILSRLLHQWGIGTIRGSSSKGGKEALTEGIEKIIEGHVLLLTPDGPRGPRRVFKPGAVIAAQRSKSPLFLARINVHSSFVFKKSWDKFVLPLPYSMISVSYVRITLDTNDIDRTIIDAIIQQSQAILHGETACIDH